ncbi:BREX system Lon protease-like protein BrxL [Sulfitobacter mediterraneus]|uniref:BREX system Lon protease-like protein BrxL n=1 Tax=Sulfitobacter mediterraneus TaxID=83219 RepID=UPI0019330B89|nr:BREX system Lon protease-like protein BrxL [Sulfitobacter mediterraneus]MBM1631320.1 BREX system Lon protease-like protein BrxL [Sulfitobacter mediterraneus]MBM1639133.1 BREX system Lon protease-like protein BrxL [Sulfitobacter mediterraneus]MBM1643182.1 BREX system Lon protease-like protein BrxL [Sulfitobacter mediterraneus]MBM1647230.1 BREX system Lon protease-like protein BrxL [Sulfitobacter mediterraneus]MBM1651273.1 BREX system Lon protease-like protein BrxL [Sulfitobacter mediterraneu
MSALDEKINEHFAGYVVRKDLVKAVKGNAIVPTYVLEYLLGQYCATDDEASIESGIETVKEILRKHYVHRSEAGLIQSTIKEKGRYKVIDQISVSLNEKTDSYEATFDNLGIKKVAVDSGTVKAHPKLLVTGVWCIADVQYEFSEDARTSPWVLETIKPIQIAKVDYEGYKEARAQFTKDEWIDLLMQSIGFNPEAFGRRSKLLQLMRLIPFVERNYNIIELGPKGTGKSHIYSEFSPHGQLISGGEVTIPKLFVNNSNGRIGLVGYWDVVAFDEFAGREKTANKALVDIMKNYMANKTFSRGVNPMGAEASFAFVGNTDHNVPFMLKNSDLFEALPPQFHDSAFIDRLHAYLPGWEIDVIRGEMFTTGYGFIVDYLAEILRHLRQEDFSNRPDLHFTVSEKISTRDRDAVYKTMSGFLKVIFPAGDETADDVEELLRLALESRKRVKDQLFRIDATYPDVDFFYTGSDGEKRRVQTVEEQEFPQFYYLKPALDPKQQDQSTDAVDDDVIEVEHEARDTSETSAPAKPRAEEGHHVFAENRKGISYDKLFGPYLDGASRIVVTDPYIRYFYQIKNMMEFVEMVIQRKALEDQVAIHLVTGPDDGNVQKQRELLESITEACIGSGVDFTWAFDGSGTAHSRDIVTDTGWKIVLDRGLDIFQAPMRRDGFSLGDRLQQHRMLKNFYVTYVREK